MRAGISKGARERCRCDITVTTSAVVMMPAARSASSLACGRRRFRRRRDEGENRLLVVHGLWSPERGLYLWAEDSDRTVKSPSQAVRSVRPHPFAAAADDIAALHSGKLDTVTLLLPSLRSAPLDSPELVRVTPRPAARSAPTLAPWDVPVVAVEPDAALAALALLDEPMDGARAGESIRYLSTLAAFARDLAGRGRVVPSLDRGDDGPSARWHPTLQGPDVVAWQKIVASMPPICRAESHWPEETGGQRADTLAGDALARMVDAAVRERLAVVAALRGEPVRLAPARRGRRPRTLPAIEAWLGALTQPEARFDADDESLDELDRQLAAWQQFGAGPVGPARSTFRLSEQEATAGWRLEFLLQSIEDPSLLVPAEHVWQSTGELDRWLDDPQELLLAELGRASRLYPALAPALRHARPCDLELDTDGAFAFLSESAGLLDAAGFGVMLPAWWDQRRRIGLTLSTSGTPTDGVVTKESRFGRDQLVEFRWQLAVGDETLTDEEIAVLASAKAPLVRLRGQWVAIDAGQVERGLAFLRDAPSGQMSVGDVLTIAANPSVAGEGSELPVNGVQAEGLLGDLLAGTVDRSLQPVEVPASFLATLRPYQQRGLSWLAFLSSLGIGACLADDMGLGKTVQLLALEAHGRADGSATPPTLLICPMSVVGNWQHETARFAPEMRVYAHHGGQRMHGDELTEHLDAIDLVVTTYATTARDIDELAAQRWNRVVLDEAQVVKNRLSQAAKAVRRLDAPHRVALTGTPLENRLAELWSLMDFLNPGILDTPERFRQRYAIPIERHGDRAPAERLRAITQPYILRRLKTDPRIIDDLPDKIEINEYCRLTPEQASLYQVVVDDMMERIENSEGIERRGNVLAAMTKLKQVCNHPAQLLHDRSPVARRSGKVARLDELLDEIIAEGDRVLCFTQFTEFAEMLVPHLSARFGQDVLYLHGGTSKQRRDEMVARFQSDDGPAIFLLSLKAGGTGLNLTAANHVMHVDRWWNPAVENQATDRAFRIGQRRNVQVRKFICTGTLEERIDEMIEEKKALADMVIGDGESWVSELSTADLRRVFALTAGAVDDAEATDDE
jgi:superfamily II DNA or RNA helicase